jgi:hypothetical protein
VESQSCSRLQESAPWQQTPQEFREFARECLRWANETQSERHRQQLLEMSKTWFQAALELERWDLRDDTTMIRRSTSPRAA